MAEPSVAYFMRAGSELWRTDGTFVGTQPVAAPLIGDSLAIVGATPSHVFLRSRWYDQRLFSVESPTAWPRLWRSCRRSIPGG